MDCDQNRVKKVSDFAKQMRIMALNMAKSAGKAGCHIGGGFSSIEILACLYGDVMKYKASNPSWEGRDRFIPSKRHCVLAHYPALVMAGFVEEKALCTFHQDDGLLAGYPRNIDIGLEFSGGSLGMGLSVGTGMALVSKESESPFHVYVLLGDGECDEGAIWEALMSAAKYNLTNMTVIVDKNNMQFDGPTDTIMPVGDLAAKLEAFGWNTIEVDGHSIRELLEAFDGRDSEKPNAIIADTIKARGIPGLENTAESHHAVLTDEAYEIVMNQINEGKYDQV